MTGSPERLSQAQSSSSDYTVTVPEAGVDKGTSELVIATTVIE
jgi:hypothetical protein